MAVLWRQEGGSRGLEQARKRRQAKREMVSRGAVITGLP